MTNWLVSGFPFLRGVILIRRRPPIAQIPAKAPNGIGYKSWSIILGNGCFLFTKGFRSGSWKPWTRSQWGGLRGSGGVPPGISSLYPLNKAHLLFWKSKNALEIKKWVVIKLVEFCGILRQFVAHVHACTRGVYISWATKLIPLSHTNPYFATPEQIK